MTIEAAPIHSVERNTNVYGCSIWVKGFGAGLSAARMRFLVPCWRRLYSLPDVIP